MKALLYPNGEACNAGELVWFNEGLCVGRVAEVMTPARMRAELDATWQGGRVLRINYGLGEQAWGAPYCYDESQLAPEGIGRLTSTEELAVELLFLQLGRQIGQPIWGNPGWNYVAWLEPLPLGEGHEGYDWVWNLAIAPQEELEKVQSYRYNRATRRFLKPEEAYTPIPPRRPRPEARSLTTSKGECFWEGDLVWEHSRLGVTTTRIRSIVRPGDAEEAWLLNGEKLREPWVETTDLERDNGGTVQSASSFEQECCGKLSPTEELAVDLLFHLLEQHAAYPLRATPILRCGLSVKAMPLTPSLSPQSWRFERRAKRRLSLFVCSGHDPMLGQFLCYRFKRRIGDFVPEPQR